MGCIIAVVGFVIIDPMPQASDLSELESESESKNRAETKKRRNTIDLKWKSMDEAYAWMEKETESKIFSFLSKEKQKPKHGGIG
jgi:hypothetical protein